MNHWNGNPDSVMSAILSMTTPPVTDNGKKKKNDKRVVSKETNCKGCGEPGDILLTCKSCSVCYHPLCDDPPKDEDSAKDKVDWTCRFCRNKHFMPASGEGEEGDEATASASKGSMAGGASKRVSWKDGPGAPRSKGKASKKKRKQKKVVDLNDSIEKIMKTGVGTCKTANPSIFEIPVPYQRNDFVFPGTSRSIVKKATRRNIIDHDTETKPKTRALCFECHLSCRKAPLIQCDYCPSYFHFDCLSPPLTTPPGGIWMCPLHPEPFLESTRLTSSALSERIRLWDTTHQEFIPETVVLSFMEKTQRNPLYSFRKRFPYSKMFFTPRKPDETDYSCMSYGFANEDAMETTINTENALTTTNKSEKGSIKEKTIPDDPQDVSKVASSLDTKLPVAEAQNSKTSQLPDNNSKDTCLEGPAPKRKCTTEPLCSGIDLLLEAAAKSNESDERRMNLLKSIPLEQVYDLAFQRLRDLDAKFAEKSEKGEYGSSQIKDKPVVRNNPSQFKKKTDPMIQFYVHNTASQLDINSTAIEIGLKEATKSYYAWLNPQKYVDCSRLSSRDLFIFFDPQKLQWEFINYSPHGVVVDSVLHSLQEPKIPVQKPREMHEFKMALFERRGLKISAFNPRYVESDKTECECDKIKLKYATLISHESGGILHAGSTIRIGCLRLTVKKFTIGETAINGDAA